MEGNRLKTLLLFDQLFENITNLKKSERVKPRHHYLKPDIYIKFRIGLRYSFVTFFLYFCILEIKFH